MNSILPFVNGWFQTNQLTVLYKIQLDDVAIMKFSIRWHVFLLWYLMFSISCFMTYVFRFIFQFFGSNVALHSDTFLWHMWMTSCIFISVKIIAINFMVLDNKKSLQYTKHQTKHFYLKFIATSLKITSLLKLKFNWYIKFLKLFFSIWCYFQYL